MFCLPTCCDLLSTTYYKLLTAQIPPNATLTFEIELLDFHSISIVEIVLKNGAYLLVLLAAVFALLHYIVLPKGALPH